MTHSTIHPDSLGDLATPPDAPFVRLRANRPLHGVVRPPGSKSYTNRLLVCALADGESTLSGAALCDDTDRMVLGLRSLGIDARLDAPTRSIRVAGCGGFPPQQDCELDAGDAGTAMRFLTALACLGHGARRLDGSTRMRERPIGALVEGLRALGARVVYETADGFVPISVAAEGLTGGLVEFDRPISSQFISALLMVAPYAAGDVFVRIGGESPSRPYLDMTLGVMRDAGVEVLADPPLTRFVIAASQRYRAGEYAVEPDASGAAYLWALAAVSGGCVRVEGLTLASRQGDVRFVEMLGRMGCIVREDATGVEVRGPADQRLRGVDVDLNDMPDAAPTLATAALFAAGPTVIRNVANLRVKESDRIAALAEELRRLGAGVDVREDGLRIEPPARLTPARIRTYRDHRMAMSFSLVSCGTEVEIEDPGCVSKSFPEFWGFARALGMDISAG
ncbi:MAG: 3-phosphoshikimate 1-carboxyvinyltransferase [Phycisphaerales bacterium]|nr:3-phosphoshikimate 1-carboxyvinyltransferase [Phycisphaerales bacterium]